MFQQLNEEQADDKQGKGQDGAAMGEEERAAQATRQLESVQQDRLQLELVIGSAFPFLSLCFVIFFFTGLRAGFSSE